jgi:hypothetical protein
VSERGDLASITRRVYKRCVSRQILLASFFAAVACSSAPSGTLQIVTGGESDTFSRVPQPKTLVVDSVDPSGKQRMLATASLPASNVDLGSLDQSAVGTLQVTGRDAEGNRLLYGQSVPIQFGALDGITVPVFVQRTGELARMPTPPSDARAAPTLALLGGRYLFIGAGNDPSLSHTVQLYDFAYNAPVGSPPMLPRAPKSIVFVGTLAWLIDDSGATSFDFSHNTQSEVTGPAGGSFGDVAGGFPPATARSTSSAPPARQERQRRPF